MFRLLILILGLLGGTVTARGSAFDVWYHEAFVADDRGPVEPDRVRVSTTYAVRVGDADGNNGTRPAFVYMTIPRSGRESHAGRPDGAEFAARANLTMSWASFVYRDDVWVEIKRLDGRPVESAIIRPTTLAFASEIRDGNTLRVRVPYREEGYRFSVEFPDDLVTAYNNLSGITGQLTEDASGRAVHTEPRNALLIFAGPDHPEQRPEAADGEIFYPEPGRLENLAEVDADILYFRPGIYWMPWNEHAYLPGRVRWIHLAPGAYIKGAFQFRGERDEYNITGYGVLSGELYLYEPDRRNDYRTRRGDDDDCHGTCIKMLQFHSTARQQRLTVHGITINEPPYHSVVVYGDETSFATDFAHYKQVGAWYWQTDGVELYRGGSLAHSFLHANDDAVKLYHSHINVSDCVVWKGENGPVFQWGWSPRDIEDVRVDGVDIIHNRMYWNDVKHNTGIFNSARHYRDVHAGRMGDPLRNIRRVEFSRIRAEGLVSCAMRLNALANWADITFRDIWIERWNDMPVESQQSLLSAQHPDIRIERLKISNYRVGNEIISFRADNWRIDQPGRLQFDPALQGCWDLH